MKIKRKFLVSILCLMFLFSVTGMAFAAPQDGFYANGHRYDLTLDVKDAAYLTYLDDMAASNFDFSKVMIVSDNKFAAVQAAVDAGSISDVLQPNAHEQVGTAIPATVIPIANNGTVGPSEIVSDTEEDLVLESIAITTPADKLVYNVGDQLDINGMVVTGYYDNGSSKVLPVTEANVTGFDSSAAVAGQTLTVTVGGKTAEYTVEIQVSTVVLDRIAITTPADKLVYNVGDELDITGMVVTGYYSDSSTKVESISAANVTGFDSSAAAASQTLTVTVGGKTAEYTVEIKDAAGPATATSIIETAIAKYTANTSVTSAVTFTGNVALLGGKTVHYVKIDPAAISTSKAESSALAVKIDTLADIEKTTTANAFPISEVICGSGVGANLVSAGVLTEDSNNYIITLSNVDCPQSLLDIITAAANVGSVKISLSKQRLACTILVDKATGRVVSIENISITGTTTAYGTVSGSNTFNASAPMVINYIN